MSDKLTPETIAELEAKHGARIAVVRAKDKSWEVAFRRPSRTEYKTYRQGIHNAQQAPDATEKLARQCVIFPSKEGFDALLEEYPAIAESSAPAFLQLLGFAVEEDEKI